MKELYFEYFIAYCFVSFFFEHTVTCTLDHWTRIIRRRNYNWIFSGLPDLEIVNCWLTDLRFEEYFSLFASAGYDMPTISRM